MEIIGKDPRIIGAKKETVRERDLISRDTYRRAKNYNREEMSGWVKAIYRKAFESGVQVGKIQAETEATKKRLAAEKARITPDKHYQPFTVWGVADGTGTPLDGLCLLYSLWNWDGYEAFHLSGAADDDEAGGAAIMKTMHDADDAYSDMPLEEFKKIWDAGDYDAPGAYTVEINHVRIIEVVCMEGYEDRKAPADEAPEEEKDAEAATEAE